VVALSAPKISAPKLSVSAKPLQEQRSNYLVSPTTGEKGRVLEPLNNKPEYHRKTAMTNKYLTKIAEMVETEDELLPSISGYAGPMVLGGALGSIVPILGTAIGGAAGYGWAKGTNADIKREYEQSLVAKGVPLDEARKLKEVLPVSYLGTTLAGLPLAPLGMAVGAGSTYAANRGRASTRQRIADRLEKKASEDERYSPAITIGSGVIGAGLGAGVGEAVRRARLDSRILDTQSIPLEIQELVATKPTPYWTNDPLVGLLNDIKVEGHAGRLSHLTKKLERTPIDVARLSGAGSRYAHRGVGALVGGGLGAYGAYRALNNGVNNE
jgi:hypothetical protein